MNSVVTGMEEISGYPDTARVWIYQGSRPVAPEVRDDVKRVLRDFARQWTSHNQQLRAHGDLLYDRFVVLVADESQAGASGCSIDTSVRFIRELGEQLNIDFMDRLQFAYLTSGGSVATVHKDELPELYRSGEVTDETLVFDNLVNTRAGLERSWLIPLADSWMKRFV
ncbi:MAG: hypothetical protein R3330_15285 [Saprospiraceae bacterium]|nr:hypothetical protein [Saprospiraceae bacterium]